MVKVVTCAEHIKKSYTNIGSFPSTGQEGFIYFDETANKYYIWDGSAYEEVFTSDSATPILPITRAALRALRTAGDLDPQVHYVVTDPASEGNLDVQEIILHALNANTLSTQAGILTSHNANAYQGVYDIDQDNVLEVTDHLENKIISNSSILNFPFGVSTVTRNTVMNNANIVYTAGTLRDNVIQSDATVTITGGATINSEFKQFCNYTMSGGTLRESTVGQDSDVTIVSGDNYENVFGNSTVYRQVGTGYIRYSTIEGTTTWTNGNTNVSNVNSYVSTVNTTGSAGTISNSTFHRAIATNMQNVGSLTITDCTINNYSSFTINGATRLYLYRSSIVDYGRVLISAGSRIDASYTKVSNDSYIQSTISGGFLTINDTTVTNSSYARNTTPNSNAISNSRVEANSNMRFDGDATGGRIYYSTASSGTSMYQTTGSVNCYFYYVNSSSASQVYCQNAVNLRMYYCNASASSYLRSINNPSTHYMYYCNASGRGYVQMQNNTGSCRMYAVTAQGQSIAELRGSAGNLYYSSFSAYFYAYITRTSGTSTGMFGMGRRSASATNSAALVPFASGTAWSNI